MDKIFSEAQNIIFSYLCEIGQSHLFIDLPNIYPEEKHISLTDRIPSKKIDGIFLQHTEPHASKARKYLSKFSCFLCITNPKKDILTTFRQGYSLALSYSHSPVSKQFETFIALSQRYPEMEKEKKKMMTYISLHILDLGLIQQTKSKSKADLIIFFAKKEDLTSFTSFLQDRVDTKRVESFYAETLEMLAKGIDKRNVRFQKNISFIIQGLSQSMMSIAHGSQKVFQSMTKTTKRFQLSIKRRVRKQKEHLRRIQEIKTPKAIPGHMTELKQEATPSFFQHMAENISQTAGKITIRLHQNRYSPQIKQTSYDEFLEKYKGNPMKNMSKRRQLQSLKEQVKISIIMVVDEIDEIWLNKSVRSIKDQTYKNWELIIIDNCSPRTYLKSYLSSLNDPRTRTHFYNSRRTHSECLAMGVKLAKGDYISILEQGDEIELDTLFYVAQEINADTNVEMIYSDEDKINEQGRRVQPFIKPDWDPIMILSFPYVNHFLVLKKELIERIEAFRSYNIQDPIWDVLLRARQATGSIAHIHTILYHQRIRPLRKQEGMYHPDALKNFMARETIQGSIKPSAFPHAFYILKRNIPLSNTAILTWENKEENIEILHRSIFSHDKHIQTHVLSTETMHMDQPNIHLHQFPEWNLGQMINTIAKQIDEEYILLLDSKIRISNLDFLSVLLSFADKQTIVGTKIVDPDNIIQHSFYIPKIRGIVSTMYEGMPDIHQFETSVTRSCLAVSKKVLLIPKNLLLETPFSTEYKKSFLDIDYALSLRQTGGQVIFAPDAKVELAHAYAKEIFNELDSIKFIRKWESYLDDIQAHANIQSLLTIKT